VAARRRPSVVNQRTLGAEDAPPPEPVPVDPPLPTSPKAPVVFAEVRSSSDELWERRFGWLRTRRKVEARSGPAPSVEK
jgi:hypothetical protein